MNPNAGSFAGPSAGGAPGQGSALARLMQLRRQGQQQPQGNPGGIGYVPPAAPPQGNAINPSQIAAAGGQQQPMQQPQPQGNINPQASMNPDDAHLDLALNALGSYVKSHGNALEAKHNVPLKKAQAAAIASQNPASSGVGA